MDAELSSAGRGEVLVSLFPKHLKKMSDGTSKYAIVGDTRVKGCLMGVELVKDKKTKKPFDEAGKLVYQAMGIPRPYSANEPADYNAE